jgi:hypothetical protein
MVIPWFVWPGIEKYWPVSCICETLTELEPLLVTEIDALDVCPTATDPNASVLVEITSAPPPEPVVPLLLLLETLAVDDPQPLRRRNPSNPTQTRPPVLAFVRFGKRGWPLPVNGAWVEGRCSIQTDERKAMPDPTMQHTSFVHTGLFSRISASVIGALHRVDRRPSQGGKEEDKTRNKDHEGAITEVT